MCTLGLFIQGLTEFNLGHSGVMKLYWLLLGCLLLLAKAEQVQDKTIISNKPKRLVGVILGGLVILLGAWTAERNLDFSEKVLVKDVYQEFFRPSHKVQMKVLDEKLFVPALRLYEQVIKHPANPETPERYNKEIAQLEQGLQQLDEERVIKANDAYLYHGRRFLEALKRYMRLGSPTSQLDADARAVLSRELVDSHMAFANARSMAFEGKSLYNFASLDTSLAGQIEKGCSYASLRAKLNMQGAFLQPFVPIRANALADSQDLKEVHQPIVWVQQGKYLYVDFVNGKADSWQYYGGEALETTKDKQKLKLVAKIEKDIMVPAYELYLSYAREKSALSRKKIYNREAARKLKKSLEGYTGKLQEYSGKLDARLEELKEFKVYAKYTRSYLASIQERMQCELDLAKTAPKDRVAIKKLQDRGRELGNQIVWDNYYHYQNAKDWLKEGADNYFFSARTLERLNERTWWMSITHWLRRPGQLLQSYETSDYKDPGKLIKHERYIWVIGDGYLYGDFVNKRLVAWKYEGISNGMWNER